MTRCNFHNSESKWLLTDVEHNKEHIDIKHQHNIFTYRCRNFPLYIDKSIPLLQKLDEFLILERTKCLSFVLNHHSVQNLQKRSFCQHPFINTRWALRCTLSYLWCIKHLAICDIYWNKFLESSIIKHKQHNRTESNNVMINRMINFKN